MNILIVDDKETNLYMLKVLLQGNGYNVYTAMNGKEALEIAAQVDVDLVISDILMPEMDGFSFCRKWKTDEDTRSIPFVFYTATYTDPKDQEFAISLGAERFIIKPTQPSVFVEIIKEVIRNHKQGNLKKPPALEEEEVVYLKEYNQTLIRKLESKLLLLEEANYILQVENEERNKAEQKGKAFDEEIGEMADALAEILAGMSGSNLLQVFWPLFSSRMDDFALVYAGIRQQDFTLSIRSLLVNGEETAGEEVRAKTFPISGGSLEAGMNTSRLIQSINTSDLNSEFWQEIRNLLSTTGNPDQNLDLIQSAMFVPLKDGEEIAGFVGVLCTVPCVLDEDQIPFLEAIARQLMLSWQNVQVLDGIIRNMRRKIQANRRMDKK